MIELLQKTAQLSGQRLARSRMDAVRVTLERSQDAPPAMRFLAAWRAAGLIGQPTPLRRDRKSTRLNSSH